MAKSVYLISEAAKEVCVENHVLRYWEEELALPVKRNSQGHRYYTAEDLNTFKKIKYLKEQGLQLRAIKLFLSKDGKLLPYRPREVSADETKPSFAESGLPEENIPEAGTSKRDITEESRREKAQKLQMILKIMIEETLREYDSSLKDDISEELSGKICAEVKDAVAKEMDYQFRTQDEREEQRDLEREERDRELLLRIEEILEKKKEKVRQEKKAGFLFGKLKNKN